MLKSNRSKSANRIIGKGGVTPIQVAFLVDRYLLDNSFTETRILFRSEASFLISKTPVLEVPNSLKPLNEILNEYIRLKEEKMVMDQEKAKLVQEKTRVQNLLHGMQDVMNAYSSTTTAPPPPPVIPVAAPTDSQVVAWTSKTNSFGVSPSGNACNDMPVSLPGNKRVGNFTAPSMSQSITKRRKSLEVSLGTPPVSRKGMKKNPQTDKVANYLTFQTSSQIQRPMNNRVADGSSDLTSSAAKCLFNKSDMSPPTNSACPRTPQKQASRQSDKSTTPQQEVTPTNWHCTTVNKERITVSPLEQMASYTEEMSHIVSSFSPVKSNLKKSSKRDHLKERLSFDDNEGTMQLDAPANADMVSTSSPGSEPDADLFWINLSNIDLMSEDFLFPELLVDFDLGCEECPDPCLPQPSNFHIETVSGSSPESMNGHQVPDDQVVSKYTSTVTEMSQGEDMNTQVAGSGSMSTVKSITKSLRILSPDKNCRQRGTNH